MVGTSINILSNNCLGGFIYRDVLKVQYQNPFIWTLLDDDQFISLVKNYNSINFNKYVVQKRSNDWNINNDFDTIIDSTYHIQNIHMHFDQHAQKPESLNGAPPTERHLWTDGVKYNKIWEYIGERYIARVQRMKQTTTPVIAFWHKDGELDPVNQLIQLAKDNNYPIILFDNRIKQVISERTMVLPVPTNIDRPQPIVQMYKSQIYSFLTRLK